VSWALQRRRGVTLPSTSIPLYRRFDSHIVMLKHCVLVFDELGDVNLRRRAQIGQAGE